jgi:CheY-like chemotaxis protein
MSDPTEILLVDDDPAGAELTLAALAELGLGSRVQIVDDGEQALDFLFRRGPYADLPEPPARSLLLDLKMPKVDGHEVLRQVRGDPRLKNLRVIVLTSSDQEADMQLSQELGTDAYVVKPTSILDLIARFRELRHLLLPPDPASAT